MRPSSVSWPAPLSKTGWTSRGGTPALVHLLEPLPYDADLHQHLPTFTGAPVVARARGRLAGRSWGATSVLDYREARHRQDSPGRLAVQTAANEVAAFPPLLPTGTRARADPPAVCPLVGIPTTRLRSSPITRHRLK